ncbi:SCO7613 C-terminal domain-containing membrane protein [Cellulomonas chengniuliangii]|uniref:Integral membrane protein n=1 Tax=Cellulomonas chengniuliangii TaxID=2968084 RepID=A0ABY5L1A9_9CELL|nr:hypothetical protein [Cellulomonas chengniuliangii]MCC2308173.1 hypothetical protein [Cellulomonas chengniuliangii]UUI76565.1 hypothetical protein NP064_06675 [Cellulomonas chengniuliangii]
MPSPQRPDQPRDLIEVARGALANATACPSCGAWLTTGTCDACGLDLTGPAGRRLWDLSQEAIGALDRRAEHLDEMRAEQHRRRAARAAQLAPASAAAVASPAAWATPSLPAPLPSVVATAPSPTPPPPSSSSGPPMPVRPTSSHPATPPLAPAPARAAWRVQTVLQVLGALLIAAACVVFLLFSWGWLGLVGRAAVIGVGTVVVFVAASALRRARLGSSAEAVGGIGTVMLLLDAWAVHATGLVAPSSGALYAGAACLVCALLLGAWGHLARIRTGAAVAAVLLPVAPVLLAPLLPGHTAWLLAGSALLASSRFAMRVTAAAGGHPPGTARDGERVRGWSGLERGIMACVAWMATGSATVVAAIDVLRSPAAPMSPVAALLVLAMLAALQGRWSRGGHPRGALAWETTAGGLLALGVAAMGVRTGLPADVLWAWGPVGAAAVTISLSRAHRPQAGRRPVGETPAHAEPNDPADVGAALGGTPPKAPASAGHATRGALVVTLLLATPSAVMLLSMLGALLFDARLLPRPLAATAIVVGALSLHAATTFASPWRAARTGSAWATALAVLVLPGLVVSSRPGTGAVGLVLMLAGVAALAHVADGAGLRLDGDGRAPLRALVMLAPAVALIGSRDALTAGLALLACAVAGGVARRWASGRPAARAALLAASLALLWLGCTVLLAEWLTVGTAAAALAVPLLTAVVTMALARRSSWTRADCLSALSLAAAISVIGWTWGALTLPARPAGLDRATLVAVTATAALAAVAMARRGRSALGPLWQVAAAGACGVLMPGTLLTLSMATRGSLPGVSLPVVVTAAAGACVLLAGLMAAGHEDARRAAEVTAWAMAGTQLLAAAATVGDEGGAGGLALTVVVAAVVAGAWSLRPDRQWARWWALGLGVTATWVLLLHGGVGVPEAYVAPTGAVLLVVALRRRRLGGDDDVPLLASGLALATLPTALLGGSLPLWDLPRPALALGAGAVLVACGTWKKPTPALAGPRRDVLLCLAALVLLVGPTWHAAVAALHAQQGLPDVEPWSLPAAALISLAWWRLTTATSVSRRAAVVVGLPVIASAAAIPSLMAVDTSTLGVARWSLVFAACAMLALRGAMRGSWRTPGGIATVPVGLALAGLAALTGSASASTLWDIPFSLLGLLLVVSGALLLRGGARDASWLSVGGLLLLPTALQGDAWRMLAALLVGAALVAAATRLGRPSASRLTVLVGGALVLAGPARSAAIAALGPHTPSAVDIELWTIAASGVIVAATRALRRADDGRNAQAVTQIAPWLVMLVLVLPTALAVGPDMPGVLRWACVMCAGAATAWWAAWSPPAGGRAAQLVAIGVAACALATPGALQHGVLPSVELPLVACGVVVTVTGALWASSGRAGGGWLVVGPPLLACLALGPAAGWRGPLALAASTVLIVAGALMLSRRDDDRAARASAGPLLGAALLSVLVAVRHAAVPAAGRADGVAPGVGDVEVWSLPGGTLLALTLILAARRWPFTASGPRQWGLPLLAAVTLAPSVLAVDGTSAGSFRALAVLTAGSALALVVSVRVEAGAARGRAIATGVVSASVAAAAGAASASASGVPADVYVVLLGVVVLALGVVRLRRDTDAHSWATLTIGLVLMLVVPFATAWASPTMWRLLLVTVGALLAVIAGAVLRWQAPFLLGGLVLGAVALIQASPAAVAAMRVVEWWAVLAFGGALLLGLGLTYERRLREARDAVRFVGAMR